MALRPVVLDTDIISAIMREDPVVLSKALAYLMEHGRFTLSIIFNAGFNRTYARVIGIAGVLSCCLK